MSWESREPPAGFRRLSDPRTLRALAHPSRLALLELMAREGSLTVTRASELLGESSASCSYHLRQLAKYGFVEPAGGGRGRERPWRRTSRGQSYTEAEGSVEARAAAETLTSLIVDRHLHTISRWLEGRRHEPEEWRRAAGFSDRILYVTPEELSRLDQRVFDLIDEAGYAQRTDEPDMRPSGARAVSIMVYAVPLPEPGAR
jgi:predicted ArsR family transcriptional regulator